MKKKIVALVLVIALAASLAVALAACDNTSDQLTFGLICLHDENSTYDKNFIDAAREAADAKGARLIIKTGIPESSACYDAAVDLVDQGCDVILRTASVMRLTFCRLRKSSPMSSSLMRPVLMRIPKGWTISTMRLPLSMRGVISQALSRDMSSMR